MDTNEDQRFACRSCFPKTLRGKAALNPHVFFDEFKTAQRWRAWTGFPIKRLSRFVLLKNGSVTSAAVPRPRSSRSAKAGFFDQTQTFRVTSRRISCSTSVNDDCEPDGAERRCRIHRAYSFTPGWVKSPSNSQPSRSLQRRRKALSRNLRLIPRFQRANDLDCQCTPRRWETLYCPCRSKTDCVSGTCSELS